MSELSTGDGDPSLRTAMNISPTSSRPAERTTSRRLSATALNKRPPVVEPKQRSSLTKSKTQMLPSSDHFDASNSRLVTSHSGPIPQVSVTTPAERQLKSQPSQHSLASQNRSIGSPATGGSRNDLSSRNDSLDEEPPVDDHAPVMGLWAQSFMAKTREQGALLGIVILVHIGASWFGFSMAWSIIVFALGAYYTSEQRKAYTRHLKMDIMKVQAIPEEDPGQETVEWLNGILKRFWIQYEPGLSETIVASIDPILEASCPGFLDSIKFSEFTLGSEAPRVNGIKYYHKTEDDMSNFVMNLSFTPSAEKTSVGFRRSTICLAIRVGKGLAGVDIPILVKDVELVGDMEFKMKMMSAFPHIKTVEMAFVEAPKISFVLKPVGGNMGLDIMNLPGLNDFILDLVNGGLSASLVKPVWLPIDVDQIMNGAGAEADAAKGVLRIKIFNASNLKRSEIFGTVDPFVKISLEGVEVGRTKVLEDNLSPFFDETKYLLINRTVASKLNFQVIDFNGALRKDAIVGEADFELPELSTLLEPVENTITLQRDGKTGKGDLRFDATWFPVLEAIPQAPDAVNVEEGEENEASEQAKEAAQAAVAQPKAPESDVGILRINVHQAAKLDGKSQLSGTMDGYVKVVVKDQIVLTTKVKKRKNDPAWEEWIEVFVPSFKRFRASVQLFDKADMRVDPLIGIVELDSKKIQAQLDEPLADWFNLAKARQGKLRLSFKWKPVSEEILGGLQPVGVIRTKILRCMDLKNVEKFGKADPYVQVKCLGKVRAKTRMIEDELNPEFNEIHYIVTSSTKERLTYEVFDWNKTRSGKLIGLTEMPMPTEDVPKQQKKTLQAGKGKIRGQIEYVNSFHPIVAKQHDPNEEDSRNESRNLSPAASKGSLNSPTSMTSLPTIDPHYAVNEYQSGIIRCYVYEVKNLPRMSDYFIEFHTDESLGSIHKSKTVKKTKRAFFEDYHDFFVRDVSHTAVTLVLCEQRGGDSYREIAEFNGVCAQEVLTAQEWRTMHLCLDQADSSSSESEDEITAQTVRPQIRIDMTFMPAVVPLEPTELRTNTGALHLEIIDASSLPAADLLGSSDPYVQVLVNGEKAAKTSVHKKTKNPTFNETFLVPVRDRINSEVLLEVRDYNKVGASKLLGTTTIDIASMDTDYFHDPLDAESGATTRVTLDLQGCHGKLTIAYMFVLQRMKRLRRTNSNLFAAVGTGAIKGVGAVGTGVMTGVGAVGSGVVGGVGRVGGGVVGVGKASAGVIKGAFGIKRRPSSAAVEENQNGQQLQAKKSQHSLYDQTVTPDNAQHLSAANSNANLQALASSKSSQKSGRSNDDADSSMAPSVSMASLNISESGSISCTVIEARGLVAADHGGTSDPYVKGRLHGPNTKEKSFLKTKAVKKTVDPHWMENAKINIPRQSHGDLFITFNIKDRNRMGFDVDIGCVTLDIWAICKGDEARAFNTSDTMTTVHFDQWLPVQTSEDSKFDATGELHVQLEIRVPTVLL